MTSLEQIVEQGDLDQLVRTVDRLCETRDWDGLVELRDRCRWALERGKQLWPAASLAEYRLALEAPGKWAAGVLAEGAGRFALGPLPEVAASTHSWGELAPHLAPGPLAAITAHERVLRGEDLAPRGHRRTGARSAARTRRRGSRSIPSRSTSRTRPRFRHRRRSRCPRSSSTAARSPRTRRRSRRSSRSRRGGRSNRTVAPRPSRSAAPPPPRSRRSACARRVSRRSPRPMGSRGWHGRPRVAARTVDVAAWRPDGSTRGGRRLRWPMHSMTGHCPRTRSVTRSPRSGGSCGTPTSRRPGGCCASPIEDPDEGMAWAVAATDQA